MTGLMSKKLKNLSGALHSECDETRATLREDLRDIAEGVREVMDELEASAAKIVAASYRAPEEPPEDMVAITVCHFPLGSEVWIVYRLMCKDDWEIERGRVHKVVWELERAGSAAVNVGYCIDNERGWIGDADLTFPTEALAQAEATRRTEEEDA